MLNANLYKLSKQFAFIWKQNAVYSMHIKSNYIKMQEFCFQFHYFILKVLSSV